MRRRFLLLPLVVVTVVILGCGESVPVPPEEFWRTATPEAVREKLRAGMDVNAVGPSPPGWTPLHYAVNYSGDTKIVSLLLNEGAVVDARDDLRRTPLHVATEEWRNPVDPEIVKLLVAAGADVNAIKVRTGSVFGSVGSILGLVGWAPLMNAVLHPDAELSSILIEAGADVNMPSGGPFFKLTNRLWGWTSVESAPPLHWAMANYRGPTMNETIAHLINAGADVNFRTRRKSSAPLHFAAYSMGPCYMYGWRSSTPSTITRCAALPRLLVEAGADIGAEDDNGATPLHMFVRYGLSGTLSELVGVLIDAGADVRARDAKGLEPIHYATFFGNGEDVAILARSRADVNVRMGPYTALHIALLRGCGGFYTHAKEEILCKSGRYAFDDLRSNGLASLAKRFALCEDTEDLVQALIEAGADVDAYSDCGLTPLHVAALGKSGSRFLNRLLANGANPCKADCNGYLPVDYARENKAIFDTQTYDLLSASTSACARIVGAESDFSVESNSCRCTGGLLGLSELIDWIEEAW